MTRLKTIQDKSLGRGHDSHIDRPMEVRLDLFEQAPAADEHAQAVEWADPGDALIVHLKKVRPNRDRGRSANRLGLFAPTPEAVEHVYPNEYKRDLVRKGGRES